MHAAWRYKGKNEKISHVTLINQQSRACHKNRQR